MSFIRTAAQSALLAAALIATGCGHAIAPVASVQALGAHDYGGIDVLATHKPKRTPKRASQDGAASKMLANAAVEAKSPGAFVLGADAAEFRQAQASQADAERKSLARKIAADKGIMGAFAAWEKQSQDQKMAVLGQIADIEGKVMGFKVPPMDTKAGAPKDGTMAYFAGARDGLGSVTLFPEAIARGDKWAAIATVTHEMRHAYQFQLVLQASRKQLKAGSTNEALAYGFYLADVAISKAGGEDAFSYGDYCHLDNEFDAFATGNMVAQIVSKGNADTSGLGFVDMQYNAKGEAFVSLAALEAKVGADRLLDAVNQIELKLVNGGK